MEEKTIIRIQCDNPFIFTISDLERCIAFVFDQPKRCQEVSEKESESWPVAT